MSRYAVIDFETTGMSPYHGDRATEIGAVLVEDGKIVDRYQSLMNPGRPIPSFIVSLTGITNDMVKAAPMPAQVMQEVNAFVSGAILVAHNASFDRKFWEAESALAGVVSQHQFLCTVLLSRRLYPWAPSHKLRSLVELHQLPTTGTYHRALADAEMTANLFMRMERDLLELYGEVKPDFLAEYQNRSRHKVKSAPPYLPTLF